MTFLDLKPLYVQGSPGGAPDHLAQVPAQNPSVDMPYTFNLFLDIFIRAVPLSPGVSNPSNSVQTDDACVTYRIKK